MKKRVVTKEVKHYFVYETRQVNPNYSTNPIYADYLVYEIIVIQNRYILAKYNTTNQSGKVEEIKEINPSRFLKLTH